jgi:hypothetical protein
VSNGHCSSPHNWQQIPAPAHSPMATRPPGAAGLDAVVVDKGAVDCPLVNQLQLAGHNLQRGVAPRHLQGEGGREVRLVGKRTDGGGKQQHIGSQTNRCVHTTAQQVAPRLQVAAQHPPC